MHIKDLYTLPFDLFIWENNKTIFFYVITNHFFKAYLCETFCKHNDTCNKTACFNVLIVFQKLNHKSNF